MNQDLLNFWKNYEDIINWGNRISRGGYSDDIDGATPTHKETTENYIYTNTQTEENEYDEDNCSSSSSVDIDLEYLNFSKKTLEHQKTIKNEKKKLDKEYGFCNSSNSENENDKIIFVEKIIPKEFYGSKVDTIESLENKLQFEFDQFCFTKKPVLWPGMAFNLSVPDDCIVLHTF